MYMGLSIMMVWMAGQIASGCRVDPGKGQTRFSPMVVEASPDGNDTTGNVSVPGMTFRWSIDGDRLHGTMNGHTNGWVAVGFNDRDELKGAKLVMGYASGNDLFVEERIAVDPPVHLAKTQLGGRNNARVVGGYERDGWTTIEFSIPLDSGESPDVVLHPGRRYHLILAYSDVDDFIHHSRMRTAVSIEL